MIRECGDRWCPVLRIEGRSTTSTSRQEFRDDEKPISPLRQRMIEDMNARNFCAGTQNDYIRAVKTFTAFLGRSPDTATAEDLRRFQLQLAETGMSICNRNRIMTGLRFLFRVTLRRLDFADEVYHLREPQKIPQVMSPDEIEAPAGGRQQSQGSRDAQS